MILAEGCDQHKEGYRAWESNTLTAKNLDDLLAVDRFEVEVHESYPQSTTYKLGERNSPVMHWAVKTGNPSLEAIRTVMAVPNSIL